MNHGQEPNQETPMNKPIPIALAAASMSLLVDARLIWDLKDE